MNYDLSENSEIEALKKELEIFIENKYTVEFKKAKKSRTSLQNRSLHKFFRFISDSLNEIGMDFCYTGLRIPNLHTRYTPDIVKNFIWRPIQIAMFNIESTTEISTFQINEISDVLVKYFGELGIDLAFPSKELVESLKSK